MKKLKAFIWACQDRWDEFKESRLQQFIACILGGVVIGAYLHSLVCKCAG